MVDHGLSAQELAMEYISMYGYIDGDHHKQWALDQVARILLGTPVVVTEARWSSGHKELRYRTGEPSPEYLEWLGDDDPEDDDVVGIAP